MFKLFMEVPEIEKLRNEKKQKRSNKMATLGPNILLITGTLNIKGLTTLTERKVFRKMLAVCLKNMTLCCLHETQYKGNGISNLKVKG